MGLPLPIHTFMHMVSVQQSCVFPVTSETVSSVKIQVQGEAAASFYGSGSVP